MFRRALLWFENTVAYLVRVFFLLGMFSGTAFFFMHSILPEPVLWWFGAISSGCFTLAVEGFVYSQQVRLNVAFVDYQKSQPHTETRNRAARSLKVASFGMAAVWAVSCTTSFAFWLYLVRPSNTFSWTEVIVLGFVIPTLYVMSSLVTKVRMDASDILSQHADDMTLSAMNSIGRQWKARLHQALGRGQDLAPIAITLMADAGETDGAKRVATIANGLNATDGVKSANLYLPQTRSATGAKGNEVDSLNRQSKRASKVSPKDGMTMLGRKPRRGIKLTPKSRVFAYLNAHSDDESYPSIQDVMKGARVSNMTAIKYRNEWFEDNSLRLESGT